MENQAIPVFRAGNYAAVGAVRRGRGFLTPGGGGVPSFA